MMVEHRPTVNLIQAAKMCGVCRRTIYNWVKWEWVTVLRAPNGAPRFYRDELLYIKDHEPKREY